jgi:CheY-like chemotaxis protein
LSLARPDLILLDIMMPGMDGVEVSRRLRADPVTAGIPIVVMSAQHRLRATAAQMPIDDRLPKPFALDLLFSTIERWIGT